MNTLYKRFYELINSYLEGTLKSFKKEILNKTEFKFADDVKDKIDFLKDLKHEITPINHFPNKVIGVHYSKGSYTLNETEINELIDVTGVNLKDVKNGLFNNENDKTKSIGWRSHSIVLSTLNYCLELQIINELIKELNTNNFKTAEGDFIFLINDKVNSEAFFKFLVENWLKNEPNKITALKHITYKLWYKNNLSEIPFKITSTLTSFADYWNNNYKHLLELDVSNPKLNEEDKTKVQYYNKKLLFYLDEFKGV